MYVPDFVLGLCGIYSLEKERDINQITSLF